MNVTHNFSTLVEKNNFVVINGGDDRCSAYLTLKRCEETINGNNNPFIVTQTIEFAICNNNDGKTKESATHTFTKSELVEAAQMMLDFAKLCD